MVVRTFIVALVAVACVPVAMGQVRGGGHVSSLRSGFRTAVHRSGFGRSLYYGDPYLFADYPSESFSAGPTSPQIIVLQPAPTKETQPAPSAENLLIELRGDRYIHVGDSSSQPESSASIGPDTTFRQSPEAASARTPVPLPPAVLIYRDGHSERVPDYSIVGSVIYARGDYWQQGYWTKPIQLSVLNIPATIQANQQQGVKFVLPSAPNEVVTRP